MPAKKFTRHKSSLGLGLAQHEYQLLVWHKKFGPAQNILGTVKGQGFGYPVQKLLCESVSALQKLKVDFILSGNDL